MSQRVAAKMLNSPRGSVLSRSASPLRPMNRDFQLRFTAGLLILLTTAAVVLACINFQKEPEFQIPYDGVSWMEHNGSLFADRVEASGPGARAGIKQGDQLVAVNEHEVKAAPGLIRQLYRVGPWSKATYSLLRQSVPLDTTVILIPADRSLNSWLRLIALIYLGIGIYVLLRRWTAPGSTHFYIFCLVSFVFYAFKYTGKLNDFDWTIYWVNVTAWLLQPALFLHFVLTFPEKRQFVSKHQCLIPLVYFPGLVLLIRQILAIRLVQASESLRWSLDRTQMAYLATYFIAAAVVLLYSYRRASTPILRQQLKWVTRGTILAVVPFTLFYVIPYLTGAMPTTAMKVSVLSLGLLPLTFGYAIIRYRLMDVDLIFKRGMTYTLATAIVTLLNLLVIGVVAEKVHSNLPNAGEWGLIVAVVITALLFDPIKRVIQQRLDRVFYRKRYDYRRTLVEFARDLNSETDLRAMLSAVVNRLSHTLLVDRLAIFLASEKPEDMEKFFLAKSFGISSAQNLELD